MRAREKEKEREREREREINAGNKRAYNRAVHRIVLKVDATVRAESLEADNAARFVLDINPTRTSDPGC